MAGWDIKKIKRWVFLGFSLWALLAFVAWHRIENCSSMFSEYCLGVYGSGVLKFLSLSWVWDYQTLVAGGLAFGGGAFVLMAARYNAVQQKQDAEAQRLAALQVAYSVVACELAMAAFKLDPNTSQEDRGPINKEKLFLFATDQILEIYKDNPLYGAHIYGLKHRVEAELEISEEPNAIVSAKCYALGYVLLTELKENLNLQNLHVRHLEFEDITYLQSKLADLNLDRNCLGTIDELLDWQ